MATLGLITLLMAYYTMDQMKLYLIKHSTTHWTNSHSMSVNALLNFSTKVGR